MNDDGNLEPLTPGSHLNPLTQSRGYVGWGQFPAGPAGPSVTPEGRWKVGSNSTAKAGVVFGVIAIPLGWIQVIGYAFALLFGALAIVLGAIGLIRAGRLPAESGRYIAVLAVLLGIAVVIWKVIEGVGPAVVVTGA
jgi:hypothetical protein